jgi:hypothetical protein
LGSLRQEIRRDLAPLARAAAVCRADLISGAIVAGAGVDFCLLFSKLLIFMGN